MTRELEDRIAVLVGGAGEIGSAAALDLARHGARAIILDINKAKLEQAILDIRNEGLDAEPRVTDALNFDGCARVIDSIVHDYGPIDFFTYLVGWIELRPSIDVPLDEFRRTLDVNLVAQFEWAKAVARSMIREDKRGSILLISSILSFGGIPRRAGYTAARGGVNQLVRTLAVEWAQLGIRVNAIAPGWVETQALRELELPLDDYRGRTPMGRLAKPDEVASVFRFFASDASRWVTGTILPVDGGVTAYLGPANPSSA